MLMKLRSIIGSFGSDVILLNSSLEGMNLFSIRNNVMFYKYRINNIN